MTRLYTRTGDNGSTGLLGGQRVSKSSLRVEACGTVDELNSTLGVVLSGVLTERVEVILRRVQDTLFVIGGMLARPDGANKNDCPIPELTDEDVSTLETVIDETEKELSPLTHFILPGGTVAGAGLHLARAVCRRAERRCVALGESETVDPIVIRYLNRLSDLCFVLARYLNHLAARG